MADDCINALAEDGTPLPVQIETLYFCQWALGQLFVDLGFWPDNIFFTVEMKTPKHAYPCYGMTLKFDDGSRFGVSSVAMCAVRLPSGRTPSTIAVVEGWKLYERIILDKFNGRDPQLVAQLKRFSELNMPPIVAGLRTRGIAIPIHADNN